MSEKKKDEGHAEEGKDAKKKGGIMAMLTKLPVLIGGVMVIEAAVLLVAAKFIFGSAPAPATGAELHGEEKAGAHGEEAGGHGEEGKEPKKERAEIVLAELRAPNKISGRTFLFDVAIYASVKGDNEEKAKSAIEQRKALISDSVRTIIAQSDPEKLNGAKDPGLQMLRRQVKFRLEEILQDDKSLPKDMILDVYVPKCTPFRADF
jgi:flagellar basal body-associated protein FliL